MDNTRYDFMTPSDVEDPVTHNVYPDPLSFNVFDFKTQGDDPTPVTVTNFVQSYLWMKASQIYGAPYWDDVVLTLNGVSHKNLLNPGDVLLFPTESSIVKSFTPGR